MDIAMNMEMEMDIMGMDTMDMNIMDMDIMDMATRMSIGIIIPTDWKIVEI